MEIDLSGKVALVTGSSRGIGKAIAIELAKHGSNVVVNYRRRKEEAENTIREIQRLGAEGLLIQADVSSSAQVQEMFRLVKEKFGRLDILVNNAGWGLATPFSGIDEQLWDRTINVNLKSVYLCTKEALKLMNPSEYGRIVNISSIAGLIGIPMLSAYSAAKAGIIGLTKALAVELSDTNITVNAIAAGIVKTKMGESLFDVMGVEEKEWAGKNTLTGKIVTPGEVASLVVYLASEQAQNITGQTFIIDSGLTLAITKRMFD
ncbi:MAG: SDR family NAD(P)-dependent oxidoreductase [Candidatus Njordarchaeia archaeon]